MNCLLLISKAMTRNRFRIISKFINITKPSDIISQDKMWKLRPLSDMLGERFLRHFRPEQNLSFDETMIAYFGRHFCKQFIKGKPLRFGYKVWCLNTPRGYLISFEIYHGKNARIYPEFVKKKGKCVSPLL